jgi:hypothetical protein
MDIALARIVLSIGFGIVIGLIMAAIFKQPEETTASNAALFEQKEGMRPALWVYFGQLVAVQIAGTLQVDLLTGTLFSLHLPLELSGGIQAALDGLHLTLQGALLIGLLVVIAPVAWKGLNNVLRRLQPLDVGRAGAGGLHLLVAAPRPRPAAWLSTSPGALWSNCCCSA